MGSGHRDRLPGAKRVVTKFIKQSYTTTNSNYEKKLTLQHCNNTDGRRTQGSPTRCQECVILYHKRKLHYNYKRNLHYNTTTTRWVADTGIACRAGPSVLQQLPLGTHSENVPFDTLTLHPTPCTLIPKPYTLKPSVLQQLPPGTHSENVPFETQTLHPTL